MQGRVIVVALLIVGAYLAGAQVGDRHSACFGWPVEIGGPQ
jgi:hypothetical protein